jgi:adenylyl- and sulfurtransferase ThiI
MEEMRQAGKKRNEIIAKLDDALKNNASEETLDKIIKEFVQYDDRAGDIRNKFYQDLKDVFSNKQIAQFIVFEKNFNQNIREIMHEMTQERERREP